MVTDWDGKDGRFAREGIIVYSFRWPLVNKHLSDNGYLFASGHLWEPLPVCQQIIAAATRRFAHRARIHHCTNC